MRGAYTGGVLDAFMELGIAFYDCYGVSAGAGNALSYISNQKGRNYRLYTEFVPDKRYLSVSNFFKTGSMFGRKFVFYDVPNIHLYFDYDAYKNSKIKLTAVATNVITGKPFYKKIDDISTQMHYVCASAAIPLASTIVKADGCKLLDGGTSDSIPIEHSISMGNNKNVIVLTRKSDYRAKKSKFAFMFHLRYLPYQKFAKVAANRYEYYNKSLEIANKEEMEGNAIIIRPKKPLIADKFTKDPKILGDLYKDGYNDVMEIKEQLLNFLSDCSNVEISK